MNVVLCFISDVISMCVLHLIRILYVSKVT